MKITPDSLILHLPERLRFRLLRRMVATSGFLSVRDGVAITVALFFLFGMSHFGGVLSHIATAFVAAFVVLATMFFRQGKTILEYRKLTRKYHRIAQVAQADKLRIEEILSTVNDGLWTISARDYSPMKLSQGVAKLFGHPLKKLMRPSFFFLIIHPDDREMCIQALRCGIKEGKASLEYRVVHSDGSVHWIHSRGAVRGRFIKGVSSDITDRKLAEIKSRASEERLKIALSAAHLGDWVYHVKDARIELSPFAQEILGFHEETATPCELRSLIHEEDLSAVSEKIKRATTEGGHYTSQCRIWSQGEVRYIETFGQFHRNNKGEVVRAIGVTQDITDRVMADRLIEEQRQIANHTSKLATVGELASNIAHEISTPLSVIMANGALLGRMAERGDVDPSKVRSISAQIVATVERSAEVITGLKRLMRNEDEKKDVFSLRDTAAQALSLTRARFSNHRIHLTVKDHTNGRCNVYGSEIQLFQVVINLLNNAFDALVIDDILDRRVSIEIREANNQIQMSVCNSGPKIPDHIVAMLFTSFYTTKPEGKGTGLGLAISKKIMGRHGGVISLDTKDGNTCFTLLLPKHIAD